MNDDAPEPIAGLIRDHRRFEKFMSDFLAKFRKTAGFEEKSNDIENLRRFFNIELTRHIRKEEEVLFPAVQEACVDLAGAVEDMLDEHRRIREQRDGVLAALQRLDGDHELVNSTIADARAILPAPGAVPPDPEMLRLHIERLSWLLQGHFTGEEDDIFLPVEEILAPARLAALAETMALIDASMPANAVG